MLRKEFRVPLPLLAAVIGGLFWIADSAMDSLVFSESSFADAALRPELTKLWMRGLMLWSRISLRYARRPIASTPSWMACGIYSSSFRAHRLHPHRRSHQRPHPGQLARRVRRLHLASEEG